MNGCISKSCEHHDPQQHTVSDENLQASDELLPKWVPELAGLLSLPLFEEEPVISSPAATWACDSVDVERVCGFMGLIADEWKQRATRASRATLRAAMGSLLRAQAPSQSPGRLAAVQHFEWLLLSSLVARLWEERPQGSESPDMDLGYVAVAADAEPKDLRE